MSVHPVEAAEVSTVEAPNTTSPFRGPYLMFPVRIFVMSGSSVSQAITDLWISFDDSPDDKLRFVELERVRETDGTQLRSV
ncbi:MAG: hypothetical protein HW390_3364 [Candidatus Brocadiaceae bacterium]|nr:hypothetical protein [Candidatus Brocadiaceae bacterium]